METQDISKNLGNGDILIYQSEDGRILMSVWNKRPCGSHNNKWLNYFRHPARMWWNIFSIFMRKENYSKRQPVGISDKFNNTLSPVEEAYLETIKALEQQTKKFK